MQTKFFSRFRMFIAYLGPALIVSMAYMDPGNYGTDIQAGASFNYDLVWAVFLASIPNKLGLATIECTR